MGNVEHDRQRGHTIAGAVAPAGAPVVAAAVPAQEQQSVEELRAARLRSIMGQPPPPRAAGSACARLQRQRRLMRRARARTARRTRTRTRTTRGLKARWCEVGPHGRARGQEGGGRALYKRDNRTAGVASVGSGRLLGSRRAAPAASRWHAQFGFAFPFIHDIRIAKSASCSLLALCATSPPRFDCSCLDLLSFVAAALDLVLLLCLLPGSRHAPGARAAEIATKKTAARRTEQARRKASKEGQAGAGKQRKEGKERKGKESTEDRAQSKEQRNRLRMRRAAARRRRRRTGLILQCRGCRGVRRAAARRRGHRKQGHDAGECPVKACEAYCFAQLFPKIPPPAGRRIELNQRENCTRVSLS